MSFYVFMKEKVNCEFHVYLLKILNYISIVFATGLSFFKYSHVYGIEILMQYFNQIK